MKKLLAFSIIIFISLSFLSLKVYAGSSENEDLKRVVDDADMLSDSEEKKLEQAIKKVRDKYEQDIVFVYSNRNLKGKELDAYADDFFDYSGYGYGSHYSGILFIADMQTRETYISTCGKSMDDFTDFGCDYILDKVTDELRDGDYYDAVESFADLCEDFMKQAETGKPYDEDNQPGKRERNIISLIIAEVVCFFLSVLAAFCKTSSQTSIMNRVQAATQASDYLVQNVPEITASNRKLLRTDIAKHVISTSSSSGHRGGSTRHISSSGRSHGGSTRHGRF